MGRCVDAACGTRTPTTAFGGAAAPRVFRLLVVVGALLFTPLLGCAAAPDASRQLRTGDFQLPVEQRECPTAALRDVVARVNSVRRGARVPALRRDAGLVRAARARASSMATGGRLSHAGWERVVRAAGVHGQTLGENVAYNYSSAEKVMRGWLRSPGHRANIVNASFRRVGVGCVVDARGKYWWVQDFGD